MSTLETTIFNDRMGVRADWAQASCAVEALGGDGAWHPTGRQVADYRHRPGAALREQIEDLISAGGDDPADYEDEIAAALDAADETD